MKQEESDEELDQNTKYEAIKGRAILLSNKTDDLKMYKRFLKTKVGAAFITNALRVALNYKEERLAG